LNYKELSDQLKQIPFVKVESINNSTQLLVKTDLLYYTLIIDPENVVGAQFVLSPTNEDCLQIFYSDGGGIIVTPNDFVFNVEQDGFVKVLNLPPMCSIREMVAGFDEYKKNPNPSDNLDNNFGLFYFHYYIFKSAKAKGFSIPMLKDLYYIGKKNGFLTDDIQS
jgi:hypothetical protein